MPAKGNLIRRPIVRWMCKSWAFAASSGPSGLFAGRARCRVPIRAYDRPFRARGALPSNPAATQRGSPNHAVRSRLIPSLLLVMLGTLATPTACTRRLSSTISRTSASIRPYTLSTGRSGFGACQSPRLDIHLCAQLRLGRTQSSGLSSRESGHSRLRRPRLVANFGRGTAGSRRAG